MQRKVFSRKSKTDTQNELLSRRPKKDYNRAVDSWCLLRTDLERLGHDFYKELDPERLANDA